MPALGPVGIAGAVGGVDADGVPGPVIAGPRLGPTGGATGVFLGCMGGGGRGVCCGGIARGGANPPPPRGCVGGGLPVPEGPLGGVAGNPLTLDERCCNLSGCTMAGPGPLRCGCGDMPFLGPLGGDRALNCGDRGPEAGWAGDAAPREFTPPENAGESGNRLGGTRGESCRDEGSIFLAGERERGRDGA